MLITNNGKTPVTMNLRDGSSYLLQPGVPTSVPDAATTMIDDSAVLIALFNAGTLTVTTDAGGAFSGFPTVVNATDSAQGKLLPVRAKVGTGGSRSLVDETGQPLGGGGGWTSATFATAIPFAATTYMPQQIIRGALTFTAVSTGAVAGSTCYLRLIADGTNAPNFSAFKEWGSSLGWSNGAGILNEVTFFFDGVDYWYSVSQQVGVVALVTPTLSTAQILSASPTQIVLTYSAALDAASVPSASAFVITNSGGTDTVTGVAVSGSTVTLTKSRTTLATDTVTLAYTSPGTGAVQASGGLPAASFSGQAVANGLATGGTVVRLTTTAGLTESGDAVAGYNYISTAGNTGYAATNAGVSSLKIAANSDGYFRVELAPLGAGANAMPFVALTTSATPTAFSGAVAGAYAGGGGSSYLFTRGATGNKAPNVAARNTAANDIVEVARVGTNINFRISSDNGATFTLVHTETGVASNVDMFLTCIVADIANGVTNLRGSNVA